MQSCFASRQLMFYCTELPRCYCTIGAALLSAYNFIAPTSELLPRRNADCALSPSGALARSKNGVGSVDIVLRIVYKAPLAHRSPLSSPLPLLAIVFLTRAWIARSRHSTVWLLIRTCNSFFHVTSPISVCLSAVMPF